MSFKTWADKNWHQIHNGRYTRWYRHWKLAICISMREQTRFLETQASFDLRRIRINCSTHRRLCQQRVLLYVHMNSLLHWSIIRLRWMCNIPTMIRWQWYTKTKSHIVPRWRYAYLTNTLLHHPNMFRTHTTDTVNQIQTGFEGYRSWFKVENNLNLRSHGITIWPLKFCL